MWTTQKVDITIDITQTNAGYASDNRHVSVRNILTTTLILFSLLREPKVMNYIIRIRI